MSIRPLLPAMPAMSGIAANAAMPSMSGIAATAAIPARVASLAPLAVPLALAIAAAVFAPAARADGACTPAVEFAPGQVSTPDLFESRLAFTPSRNTIYWTTTAQDGPPGSDAHYTILTAERSAGGWTVPEVAAFSGVYSDSDAFVSPDGSSLFFSSSRPGGVAPGSVLNDLWVAHRTASGWSVPENLGPVVNSAANELYASTDLWGNLFFASDRDRGQWDIYRARRLPNGGYAAPEALNTQVNHPNRWEFNPEIAPNGRTLLFATYGRPDSYGDVDIYASRLEDGKWGKPQNLGPCVNTAAPEFHPTVLWDRDELYFVRVGATTDFYVTPLRLP